MPTITNLTLEVTDDAAPATTRTAKVTGTLGFDAADAGKTYRVAIALLGEDTPDDNLPATDSGADDELYTFMFGFLKPYKTVVVPANATVALSESRTLPASKLDEDSGKVMFNNHPPAFARRDEVYARVTVSGAPVTQRSNVEKFGGAVP
jgi:hypothetical protein